MKKITSFLMLFLMFLAAGSLRAADYTCYGDGAGSALRSENGKCIIKVESSNDCTITAEDGSTLAEAPSGQDLKIKVTAMNGQFCNAVLVRHGKNLDGEQIAGGTEQYKEERINIVSAKSENMVVIPSAFMDADVKIIPLVSDKALIFADEFNGADGSQPGNVWHRSERWRATWNRLVSKQNDVVFVKDGNLVCRAIKNDNPLPDEVVTNDVDMRTGAVETSGNWSFRYGKVECRAKTHLFEGTFPAIWMMPQDKTGGWPSCGEIDIFEAVNTEERAHHTIHTNWTYNLGHGATHNEYVNYDEYHTYGMEWDDTSLKFFLDGRKVYTYYKSNNINVLRQNQWPFDRNFYIILNQSVGNDGQWARKPDVNHTYEMQIDWIRVYQNPHYAKECELRAAINKVKEYVVDEGVNYYTIDHDALNAAKAVLNDAASKTTDELQAAIDAIENVAVLNMPVKNHFYRLRCADEKNQMRYIQSTETDSKIDMKEFENGKGANGTFLFNGEGFVSYTQGLYCGAGSLKKAGEKADAKVGLPVNGRTGQYTINVDGKFLNGKNTLLETSELTNDYTDCSGNWWFEEVDKLQVEFKGSDNGYYATIFAPAALTIPEGVTAYTGHKDNDMVTLSPLTGIIPANTGVLLKLNDAGDAAKTKDFVIDYANSADAIGKAQGNDFTGSFETIPADGSFYGLRLANEGSAAFYVIDSSNNMKGFDARLEKGSSQHDSLALSFDGGNTGIEEIDALMSGKAAVYDLNGNRIENPGKGIYIVNGKKIMFR